jgi:hypothetical protein
MKALVAGIALTLTAGAGQVNAADAGGRTYADPACSSRTAAPEKCTIDDGPPTRTGVRRGAITQGNPPAPNGGDSSTPASRLSGKGSK